MLSKHESGLVRQYSQISVDLIKPNLFKDSCNLAQVRQTVLTTYPAKNTNSLDDSLCEISNNNTFESDRVKWLEIPLTWTVETVEEMLSSCEQPTIYALLSDEVIDVLSEGQMWAVCSELQTLSFYENKLRVPNTTIFRNLGFSVCFKDDVDFRIDKVKTTFLNQPNTFELNQ